MGWTNPQQQTTGTLINETIWNEQVADNIDYLGAAVEPDMLANRSGGQVTAGAVVIVDSGNDSSFKTTTTADDPLAWGVVMETINNNATGRVATSGVVTVNVQGNVTRGDFLSTSTTAGRAKDAGTSKTNATFAIALTGYAGGGAGTVTALLLGSLSAGVQSSRAINTTAPLAGGGDLSADRTLSIGAASEAASGVAEIATQAEMDTGTDDARIVTPLKLKSTPLDHLKVSKLWESDGGAAAWQTDATGELTGNGTRDIFPQASGNGLNARFERLFGDDVPANSYSFTQRTFVVNDFVNHQAGFEDSQSDYSFGGSPGGFSFSKPASSYVVASDVRAHWLKMLNNHLTTHLYLQWTDTTAKTVLDTLIAFLPANLGASNNLVAEIRFWAVQSPGAGDNYWAIRVVSVASTNTEWPFQIRLYKGTGVTFSLTDGTLVLAYPVVVQQALRLKSTLAATGQFQLDWSYAEGGNFALGTVVDASYPSNFKTMRILLPAGGFQGLWLDQLEIT